MATTIYFPSTGSVPISPAYHSNWDSTSNAIRRPLNVTGSKGSTSMTNQERSLIGASGDYLVAQYVSSRPLGAQTIDGTVDIGFKARVDVTGETYMSVNMWVATSAGAVRGVLLNGTGNTTNAINSTGYTDEFRGTVALSSVICSAGDYLVIELGCNITSSTPDLFGIKIGDSSTYSAVTSDSSSTTTRLANAVFSDTIAFVAPPTSITYPDYNVDGVESTVIASNTPTTVGGEGDTLVYAIASGSLPSGVTLNTSSGIISGTPAAASAGVYTLTVSVTNSAGSATSSTLTYTIVAAAPNSRKKDAIFINQTGSFTVSAFKPVLYGALVTASAANCVFVVKATDNTGQVLFQYNSPNAGTQYIDLSQMRGGGVELTSTFYISTVTNITNVIMFGSWDTPIGRAR